MLKRFGCWLLYERYRCPLIWVMSDQEPVTGGCHYSFGCDGFTLQCGCCPQLNSTDDRDHSRATWQRKKENLANLPICFVAPTDWCRERILQSSLFGRHRVEKIPYPIDTQIFRPFDQRIARDLLHLSQDRKVIFFGATYLEDRRKGMPQLIAALTRLAEMMDAGGALQRADVLLLVAGLQSKSLMAQLPLAGKHIGHLSARRAFTRPRTFRAAKVVRC